MEPLNHCHVKRLQTPDWKDLIDLVEGIKIDYKVDCSYWFLAIGF